MRVELLYWDADPAYMATRQRLVEVLTEDAFETPIQMIAVNSTAMPGTPGPSELWTHATVFMTPTDFE